MDYAFIYLLNKNSKVVEKFKEYTTVTKNVFGRILQAIRSNNSGEYISIDTQNYLMVMGIKYQLSHIVPLKMELVKGRANCDRND